MNMNRLMSWLHNLNGDVSLIDIGLILLFVFLPLVALYPRINLLMISISEKREKALKELLKDGRYLRAHAFEIQLALRAIFRRLVDERLFYFSAERSNPLGLMLDFLAAGSEVRLSNSKIEDQRKRRHIFKKEILMSSIWASLWYLLWIFNFLGVFATWWKLDKPIAVFCFSTLSFLSLWLFFSAALKSGAAHRLIHMLNENHPVFIPPKRPTYEDAPQAEKSIDGIHVNGAIASTPKASSTKVSRPRASKAESAAQ